MSLDEPSLFLPVEEDSGSDTHYTIKSENTLARFSCAAHFIRYVDVICRLTKSTKSDKQIVWNILYLVSTVDITK